MQAIDSILGPVNERGRKLLDLSPYTREGEHWSLSPSAPVEPYTQRGANERTTYSKFQEECRQARLKQEQNEMMDWMRQQRQAQSMNDWYQRQLQQNYYSANTICYSLPNLLSNCTGGW